MIERDIRRMKLGKSFFEWNKFERINRFGVILIEKKEAEVKNETPWARNRRGVVLFFKVEQIRTDKSHFGGVLVTKKKRKNHRATKNDMPGIRDAGKYRFIFQVGILYSASRTSVTKTSQVYIYIYTLSYSLSLPFSFASSVSRQVRRYRDAAITLYLLFLSLLVIVALRSRFHIV